MVGNGQNRTKKNPRGAGTTTLSQRHPAWERLKENILGMGAARFWEELDSLEGKDYIIAWLSVLKFFKPALANQIATDITEIPTIELVDGLKHIASQNGKANGDKSLSREQNGQGEDILK